MEKTSTIIEAGNSLAAQYIIGIGASAGGLEAINEFFDNMPANTGISFILVQHLSRDHKSLMGELLSKHTEMQIYQAEDGIIPRPNCIYLIPPKNNLIIKDGRLRLEDKVRDHQPNTAIDIFFESLANDKADKAIGIVLSGTGTDGTKGIQAIKNNGGVVIVQDPITAQFDGMPNSAVASGYVDLILSPDMMPEELLEFLKEAPLIRSFNDLTSHEEAILLEVLQLIYTTTGHDFSNYKRPTINRRLGKRMAEKNVKSIADYRAYLANHPEEVNRLCKEFLLHVTRFFRDEEAFESLRSTAIPEILSKKEEGESVKIWVVASSTGEEAYTIAMLFEEALDELRRRDLEVKIFASDISQEVIDIASRGVYTDEQLKHVSRERLARFFIKESGGYRVTPVLRRMVVFAKHDITKDPPFSRIDLLTCRNMLIYMNPFLQKSILQKVHFAINDEGFLFLGPSENIGILKDVLQETDKKWKIYKCISKTRVADYDSFYNPSEKIIAFNNSVAPKARNALGSLAEIFKETLLEEYDFAGVFIDRDFEVKQAIGSFKKFLDFPEGTFNFNLLKLVPTDLSIALSTCIRRAMKDNERVVQRNVKVQQGKIERVITIIVKPYLVQKAYLQPFVFIILKEEAPLPTVGAHPPSDEKTDRNVEELERELRYTKENLQALIEEVESSNEELQSSNEEIVSANEELQSTNEELQSLNEELHTVNAEHQLKIKELIDLNDDLTNYFNNTEIGQIIINRKLIIKKFTPIATRQVNLIPGDVGRSIVDISTNMVNLDFINDIKHVMQTGVMQEKEITMQDERMYLMRIAPYVRQDKSVDGVVVNFIDITDIKKLSHLLETILNTSTSGILALEAIRDEQNKIVDLQFISANNASRKLTGHSAIIHQRYLELYGHLDPHIFETYVRVVETAETTTFEYLNSDSNRWFEIVAAKMMDGLVVTFNDITEKKYSIEKIKKGYEELQHTTRQLEQSNLDLLQYASVASHDLKEPLRKVQAFGDLLKHKVSSKLDNTEMNYLDKVISSTNRMQVLIDDILTLSRLSKTDIPHKEIDLNKVILHITEDLEVSIKEKGALFRVNPLPVVKGIPGQMHQLFQNLISNAIKFNVEIPVIEIGEQELTEEIKKMHHLGSGNYNYVVIYVQDNGIGFDEQYSEKIFGVFQRLDKTNYQGTGIGLAIAKKIVENHRGFIHAVSEPGRGARFIVLLPK